MVFHFHPILKPLYLLELHYIAILLIHVQVTEAERKRSKAVKVGPVAVAGSFPPQRLSPYGGFIK